MTLAKKPGIPAVPWVDVIRAGWPGLLLATLCLLPYLNKAYTIDDPYFLLEAEQILKTPLRPMAFEICWQGNETCGIASQMAPNAALMGYALIPAILGNGAEWIAHTEQIVFAWGAVLAMAAIAIRLGWSRRHATFAGLLLVAIPPFLPMSATAMPDTLGLCLTLVGIERLLAWKAEGRWRQAVSAGLALGIAPYGRPHLALVLGLGALVLLDSFRTPSLLGQVKESPWRWTPVGIGFLVLATIIWLTRDGGAVLRSSGSDYGMRKFTENTFSYFLYLTIPLPLAIPWMLAHWRRAPALFLAVPLACAVGVRLLLNPGNHSVWGMAASFAGAVSVAHMLYDAWHSRDYARILPALWILIPLPVVFYAHFPIKYLLAVSPAIVLILLRLSSGVSRRFAVAFGSVLVAAGTAYSCLILEADAQYADLGRRAARELIEPHVSAGERVWFGGQWGFYWYAMRAGAKLSRPGTPGPLPGDLLAVPMERMGGQTTLNRFPNRSLVQTFVHSCQCGRTMVSGAGLYTNFAGNLLWVWGRGEVARFELWRVH